ncbi:uncharacterized protein LOC107619509 isoform X2 [Arachis ipaensis]|nr:uncharacterized protein LOC107619509 isoform X2 [Arachis ipaensis]XP_025677856.1 uncharacterized protein LOC112777674 isoform X2 [Arachis hypogaea]
MVLRAKQVSPPMAASKMVLRRFFSSFQSRQHPPNLISLQASWHSSTSSILNRFGFHKAVSTTTDPTNSIPEDIETNEADGAESTSSLDNVSTSMSINKNPPVKFSAISNLKASSRHDLAMIFTCKVCETRSVKTVCRESYEKGVVVARCGGCNNLHLIADRLGWFGEPGSIEDYLAAQGEEVKKGSIDTLNLTLEDIAGKKP